MVDPVKKIGGVIAAMAIITGKSSHKTCEIFESLSVRRSPQVAYSE